MERVELALQAVEPGLQLGGDRVDQAVDLLDRSVHFAERVRDRVRDAAEIDALDRLLDRGRDSLDAGEHVELRLLDGVRGVGRRGELLLQRLRERVERQALHERLDLRDEILHGLQQMVHREIGDEVARLLEAVLEAFEDGGDVVDLRVGGGLRGARESLRPRIRVERREQARGIGRAARDRLADVLEREPRGAELRVDRQERVGVGEVEAGDLGRDRLAAARREPRDEPVPRGRERRRL